MEKYLFITVSIFHTHRPKRPNFNHITCFMSSFRQCQLFFLVISSSSVLAMFIPYLVFTFNCAEVVSESYYNIASPISIFH